MSAGRWSPLLLGALVFTVYALTRTHAHSGDDIQWMMRVEQAVSGAAIPHPASTASPRDAWSAPSRAALQPRYFLALPSTAMVIVAVGALGRSGASIVPVQLLHALWGALGVVWFFLALRRIVAARWSAVAALGLAASYAWWHYSTHADYPIAAQALSCLFLYVVVRILEDPRQPAADGAILGAAAALALLFLETRVVLIAVGAVVLWADAWRGGSDERRRRAALGGYVLGIAAALTVGIIAGAALTRFAASGSGAVADRWLAATHARSGAHGFTPLDVPKAAYGFAKSLIVYPGLGDEEPRQLLARSGPLARTVFAVWYGTIAVVALLPVLLAIGQWRALRRYRLPLLVLLAWGGLEIPFLVYWEPSYVKWFGPALIPWWGVVAIVADGAFIAHPAARRGLVTAVIGFVVVMFATNLLAAFVPAARPDARRWQDLAAALAAHSTADDLFVAAEYRPLNFYLPYFERRRAVSANLGAANVSRVRQLIVETAAAGGRVFVYPCGEPPPGAVAALLGTSSRLEPLRLDDNAVPGFTVCEVGAGPG